jgi:hypothetical protein
MKAVKGGRWCAAFAIVLGCSPANHVTPRVQVASGRRPAESAAQPTSPVAQRASVVPARGAGQPELEQKRFSDAVRDAICAAVVEWIVPTKAAQEYFVGHDYYNRVIEGPEPNVLHEDPSPLLMHLTENRARQVHPLSAYHGDGKRIIFCGVFRNAAQIRVLAKVDGEQASLHPDYYMVEFKEVHTARTKASRALFIGFWILVGIGLLSLILRSQ